MPHQRQIEIVAKEILANHPVAVFSIEAVGEGIGINAIRIVIVAPADDMCP
ncbi:hypothetical protein D3C71_2218460 [compost metagenome]